MLEQYAGASRDLGPWHDACYLVSLSGTSLLLQNREQWDLGDPAVGPGNIGRSVEPGLLALDDVCLRRWISSKASESSCFHVTPERNSSRNSVVNHGYNKLHIKPPLALSCHFQSCATLF